MGDEFVTIQQKRKSLISFVDFVKQEYLPYAETNKKISSCVLEKQLIDDWINSIIGNKPFQEITPLDLESIKNKMASSGKAA